MQWFSSTAWARRVRPLVGLLRVPLVAVVVIAVMVGLGMPASASHSSVSVAWSAPGTDPAQDPMVSGGVDVDADVTFSGGLKQSRVTEWQLQLRPEDGSTSWVLCARAYGGLGVSEAQVDFSWDSRFTPSGSVNDECEEGESAQVSSVPIANDRYELRVRAKDQILSTVWHDAPDDFRIRVNNPPATPAGVDATFDEDAQQITVTWDANAEPDLVGYLVEQCRTDSGTDSCSASDWVEIAQNGPDDEDAVTAVSQQGAYRYRVTAQRTDWQGTSVLASTPGTRESPVVLSPAENPGGSGGGDDPDGESGTGDDPGATEAPSTLPGRAENPDAGDGESGEDSRRERRRSLEPRLIQQDLFDPGFENALPYGAEPLDRTSGRSKGLLVGQEGAGNALVPIAGGLVVFVFSMQLRHLGRRASLASAAGPAGGSAAADAMLETTGSADGDADDPVPTFRPSLGGSAEGDDTQPGSFISNWKRWVPKG